MVTISVVVPCYPPHQKLIPELIAQLNKQSVLPDEIVISLSEVSNEEIVFFKNEWSKETKISLQVVGQEIQALAAVNRNYGAMHSLCDYIQFLDADDTYHTMLIETIKKTIQDKSPDAILYHLSEEKFDIESQPILYKSYTSEELFEKAYPDKKHDSIAEQYNNSPQLFLDNQIHHGHLCVKYSVWQECPQEDLKGREDSVYVRSLLWRWFKEGSVSSGVIVIPEVLTFYQQNIEHILEHLQSK